MLSFIIKNGNERGIIHFLSITSLSYIDKINNDRRNIQCNPANKIIYFTYLVLRYRNIFSFIVFYHNNLTLTLLAI